MENNHSRFGAELIKLAEVFDAIERNADDKAANEKFDMFWEGADQNTVLNIIEQMKRLGEVTIELNNVIELSNLRSAVGC